MLQGDGAQFTNKAGVTVELSDEAVLISRKGETPPLSTLAYRSIRSVVFKGAGITNGYIQFCTDTRKKVDSLNKAMADRNTVVFSKDTNEDFERLRDLVNEKIEDKSEKTKPAPIPPPGESGSDGAKSQPHARSATYRDPNKRDGANVLWTIVSVVVLLAFVLSKCSTDRSAETLNVSENLTNGSSPADLDMNAAAPAATQSVSRYLAMDSNVRAGPTSSSRALGKLTRGSRVEGTLAAGKGSLGPWLKLTSGRYAGNYILALSNLRQTPPPAIDRSEAGFRFPTDRTPIYAEPSDTSEVVGYTTIGKAIHVHGRTEGGFLEVGVRTDRVGYVREEALEAKGEPDPPIVDENGTPLATPAANLAAPPTLRNPQFIGPDDYPALALTRGEEGLVRVIVVVDINGRVTSCLVTQSSGWPLLDEASCRLMRSRASFNPAIGADGRPTSGTFMKTINWKLSG